MQGTTSVTNMLITVADAQLDFCVGWKERQIYNCEMGAHYQHFFFARVACMQAANPSCAVSAGHPQRIASHRVPPTKTRKNESQHILQMFSRNASTL